MVFRYDLRMKKVIVGLSGGVDSSVAALILKQQGYVVEGLFMKNWEEDDTATYCSAAEDVADAQAVCDKLGIPLHTMNFAHEYWESVFTQFLASLKQGYTPNPDILCNKEIKFKAFLDHALTLGADYIATGHYVDSRFNDITQQHELLRGKDPGKDQSYFLYTLNQAQLSKSLFPIGPHLKTKVREIAQDAGFITHDKKDSTGICFIGERKFRDFLKNYLPAQQGIIENENSRPIGEHEGVMYYTLGQRQGLRIGGVKSGSGEPWYVIGKDIQRNRLIVAQGHHHPALFTNRCLAMHPDWVAGHPPSHTFVCSAKTRYRQPDESCQVIVQADGLLSVEFEQAQRAVTPGQAIVFYQGPVCLGGATLIQS